jgi:hypothetical protein
VGGTAEQYWARDEYVMTDLDMVGDITGAVSKQLRTLGFRRAGRYWELAGEHVLAVEFPERELAGDITRVVRDTVHGHPFTVIGIDDLYLDRLRQATAKRLGEEDRLAGAYALLATRKNEMDFRYISRRIRVEIAENPLLSEMHDMHQQLMTGVRKGLTFPEALERLRARLRRRG